MLTFWFNLDWAGVRGKGFCRISGGVFVGNFFLSDWFKSLPLQSFILAKNILTFQIIIK
jgi:hypothetical protein